MRISDWSSDVCSSDLNVEPSLAARREHSRRKIDKNLHRWLGSVTPEQDKLLRTWEDARAADVAPQWLAFRQRWRAELATTMAARHTQDFCPGLEALVSDGETRWTPDQQQLFADNRRNWTRLPVRPAPRWGPAKQTHFT